MTTEYGATNVRVGSCADALSAWTKLRTRANFFMRTWTTEEALIALATRAYIQDVQCSGDAEMDAFRFFVPRLISDFLYGINVTVAPCSPCSNATNVLDM